MSLEPIVRHDTEIHLRGDFSRWTVAYRAPRHLATGPLAAMRNALTTALLDAPDGARHDNLIAALRAIEGCEFGEFHPAQTVDVLTREEWKRKHSDFKGGDPRRGTACHLRYDPQHGTCLVPCVVIEQAP